MLGKVDDDVPVLGSEDGMRKVDREVELEPVVGLEARPLVVQAYLDRLLDPQVAFACRLLLDTCRLQQEHEGTGAAVHDRKLGSGDVDVQIVDTEPGERGHQMLDRRDLDAVLLQRR